MVPSAVGSVSGMRLVLFVGKLNVLCWGGDLSTWSLWAHFGPKNSSRFLAPFNILMLIHPLCTILAVFPVLDTWFGLVLQGRVLIILARPFAHVRSSSEVHQEVILFAMVCAALQINHFVVFCPQSPLL